MNYYNTLGLRRDSSAEEIKKVYRKLAMQYHPDRNGGNPESENRIKEINEAYQILGDEKKRRLYDLLYRQPFENYVFREEGLNDDFVTVLRKFHQMGFDMKRTGGCRGRGFGRGGCGRWKR
ncbi:MAG: DnaJ domain-containing protein [Deltaproteobacteria bacterium]|nr:DnaJ domain-containing protein [Deltaproteobacteria bacterium]